jgi:hypothetical protein
MSYRQRFKDSLVAGKGLSNYGDPIPAGVTKPSGDDIPKPFNENDVRAWIGRFLKDLCREERTRFFPSDFLLNEEMQQANAYDAQEKEKALYNKDHVYRKLSSYCLEQLTERLVLNRTSVRDPTDDLEYTTYDKTDLLLNVICTKVNEISGLPDIDKILEVYKRHRPQQK